MDDVPSPAVQLAELRNRKFDFVLARIVRPLTAEQDVHVETLFNDQVVVAADARNRWARRRKIDLADLVGEPWMLTPSDSWVYSHIVEAFEERGLEMPKAALLTVSVPLRCHLVSNSDYITVNRRATVTLADTALSD